MSRTIATSLSPNAQKDDVLLALKILFSPIKWMDFRETEKLENQFARQFGRDYKALAVNSGRSALYLILKTLGIGQDDEVIIQALTCVAVPNSILWLNAKPVYADVDDTFNLDPKKLSEIISKRTKAIIVQHSFGVPAEVNKIKKITHKHKAVLIEDCALALGAKYNKRPVGTFGEIAFFSFGRDKVISSVFGGLILCRDEKLYKKLKIERDNLDYPPPFWVMQQLLHPILFALILPLYNFGLGKFTVGKILIYLFQKSGLLSKAVYKEEMVGRQPKIFPTKMPGALSLLALNQLTKLNDFNSHRKVISKYYRKVLKNKGFKLPRGRNGSIWVRFPIIHTKARNIIDCAKKNKILLGDWYKEVVVPVKNLAFSGYKIGSCPNAEKMAGNITNLPTYPNLTIKDAERVVRRLNSCQKTIK